MVTQARAAGLPNPEHMPLPQLLATLDALNRLDARSATRQMQHGLAARLASS